MTAAPWNPDEPSPLDLVDGVRGVIWFHRDGSGRITFHGDEDLMRRLGVHGERHGTTVSRLDRLLRSEYDLARQLPVGELSLLTTDGRPCQLELRSRTRRTAAGSSGRPVTELAGIAVDVTERAQAHREVTQAKAVAERVSRARGEFLARVTHEMRTPLNAVLGFAQLLDREELTEQQHGDLQHILTAGRHLLALVNEVLDLAHVESGRLSLQPTEVDLGALAAEVTGLLAPVAAAREVSLAHEPAGAAVRVRTDERRLRQVLLNLVTNAIKYDRVGGTVTVGCRRTAGAVEIRVRDTGRGIPAAAAGRLFEPFTRLAAEDGTTEGTGLGLAVSSRLMGALGGSVELESTGPDGSIFLVRLPDSPV